ncbi:hypothetical protein D3C86_1647170 [compost metagenome]
MAAAAKSAATDTADPPLEPKDVLDGYSAFHVCIQPLSLKLPLFANSEVFTLPIMTAPASRSLFTWKASDSGRQPSSALLPPVVGISFVS